MQRVGEGVVLLHGLGHTRHSMTALEQAVVQRGFATLNMGYASRSLSLDEITDVIADELAAFASQHAQIHFVGHSLGGLVARAYIHKYRPAQLGRVVQLGTPNGGSELVDLLIRLRVKGFASRPISRHLRTRRVPDDEAQLGIVDYALGVIAGSSQFDPPFVGWLLPRPNDGKVTIASTRVAHMADHVVLPVGHTFMPRRATVIAQTISFLSKGKFE